VAGNFTVVGEACANLTGLDWMPVQAVALNPVKKTYLTLMYLTRVLTNICRGFVLEKNLLREHVEIRVFVLQWAGEHTLLRQLEMAMWNSSYHEDHEGHEGKRIPSALRDLRALRG
jgi:hypothetical protein